MQVLVISGSRNPQGQTAQAIDALIEGLTAAAAAEVVYLPSASIERCRQCDAAGWGKCRPEGWCVIEDDFAALVDRIRAADAVVFATPVYFGDLSESLRAFTDRLRRICLNPQGRAGIGDKPAVSLAVAGGGGGVAAACLSKLEGVLRTCGFDLVDAVAARRQNLAMKKDVLRLTGQWLAAGPRSN